MNPSDFISEHEACALSGVSASTLSRFAEAGYLQIEKNNDGKRLFSQGQLKSLFGISESEFKRTPPPSVPPAATPSVSLSAPRDTAKLNHSTATDKPSAVTSVNAANSEGVAMAPNSPTEPSLSKSIEVITYSSPARPVEVAAEVTPTAHSSHPQVPVQVPLPAAPLTKLTVDEGSLQRITSLENELRRSQTIISLHEKLFDSSDARLKEVQAERDWLRTRVETLEEHVRRDQVILLSESQVVRQALEHSHGNRSPVRAALEWFGFMEPKEPTRKQNDFKLEH